MTNEVIRTLSLIYWFEYEKFLVLRWLAVMLAVAFEIESKKNENITEDATWL